MKQKILLILLFLSIIIGIYVLFHYQRAHNKFIPESKSMNIKLPKPKFNSTTSLEKALLERKSVRNYNNKPLHISDLSQLLWAAQGITHKNAFRTAPSAGALYPLEIYLVVGYVDNLANGIYKYNYNDHELILIVDGDKRNELSRAALGQDSVKNGAVTIVISAVYERVTKKYKKRGERYVHIEAGHAVQNIYLQSVSLNLGTVVIGAFDDNEVKKIVTMNKDEEPLCIMPVGEI